MSLHINSLLDSYLANGQMARNKVGVKGIEISSPASLLFTDIFVYNQGGETNIELAVRKPESSKPKTLRPVRDFNINCIPPPPPRQSWNLSEYEVNELRKQIQC